MRILILNGPNLNLLGTREPDIYGSTTLDEIVSEVSAHAQDLGVTVEAFQSNVEGELVSKIGESGGKFDGIIFNPAAYTHTSVAIRDALLACGLPVVEVHLSNTFARDDFRKENLTAAACVDQIMGFGAASYVLALQALVKHIDAGK